MLDSIKQTAGNVGAIMAWLIQQAALAKLSKKAKRRLERGEAGQKTQARVDHATRIHKDKVRAKNRARRKTTRTMKQKVQARAA